MADIPGFAQVPVMNAEQFGSSILYVILAWGKVDELMDDIRLLLSEESTCAGIRDRGQSQFNRRLAHFEHLAEAYFAPTPAMVEIVVRKCALLREIKPDRDYIAHGRYGAEMGPEGIKLRISVREGDAFKTRKYTPAELQMVCRKLGNVLTSFISIGVSSFAAETKNLSDNWKIPSEQVDPLQKLLRHIQSRYHQTTRSRYERSSV